mgnify:CR=1 FL=1
MDPIASKTIEVWGPPGIIIVALAIAAVTLWKRNSVIQDSRISEANERAKQIGELTKDVSVALTQLTDAIQSLKEMVLRIGVK